MRSATSLIEKWTIAQQLAIERQGWDEVDRIASECLNNSFRSLNEAKQACKLALERLTGGCHPPDPIDPINETWVESLLFAVWEALDKRQCLQDDFLNVPGIAHSISRDSKLLAVSPGWCDAFGYEASEVLGRPVTEFFTEECKKTARERDLPRFWCEGCLHNLDYQIISKNGKVCPVKLAATAEFDADRRPIRSLTILSRK